VTTMAAQFPISLIIGIIAAGLVIIIASIIAVVLLFKYKFRKTYLSTQDLMIELDRRNVTYVSMPSGKYDEDMDMELKEEDVVIGNMIGSGAFGTVFSGTWNHTEIALKTVKKDDLTNFQSEIKILRSLNHPNVLRFFGTLETRGNLFVVTEYCSKGNLQTFLSENRDDLDSDDMTAMILQIAKGMLYIHKTGIIHRDLAARNVLVSEDFSLKISDFGLSRRIESEYYKPESTTNKLFPVRWSAPEVLSFHKFSAASDVWAFGITVWEVFQFGARTYIEMENSEVIKQVLIGYRLSQPQTCPENVWQIVTQCWNDKTQERLTFTRIVELLEQQPRKSTRFVRRNSEASDVYAMSPEESSPSEGRRENYANRPPSGTRSLRPTLNRPVYGSEYNMNQ